MDFEQLANLTEPIEVPLGDASVMLKPPKDWRSSALAAINRGDVETWASTSLVDYSVWQRIDPTLGQVRDFFQAYRDITGAEPGKSGASLS